MILNKKNDILNWLEKNDAEYIKNIQNNYYEFIDIDDISNQALLARLIQKDHLSDDYFEEIQKEGHRYIVNVKGHVDISRKKIKRLPFQFYDINGFFDLSHNQLTSLKGCPQYVNGSFSCSYNQLTSLEYFPRNICRQCYLASNDELLKYKKESNDIHIRNMSDDDFLNIGDVTFWQQFHLQDKIMKENSQILDDLILNNKIENIQLNQSRIKKV